MDKKSLCGILLIAACSIVWFVTGNVDIADDIALESQQNVNVNEFANVIDREASEDTNKRSLKCDTAEQYINGLKTLYSKKNAYINAVIEGFNHIDVPNADMEAYVQLSGIDIGEYRSLLYSSPQFPGEDFTTLRPLDEKYELIENSVNDNLTKNMYIKDYVSILDMIRKGELNKNHLKGDMSVLASVIMNDSNITLRTIEEMIELGLSPNFKDLYFVANTNRSIELLEILVRHFPGKSLNRTWEDNFHVYTLVMLAIENLNVDQFDLWRKYGSELKNHKDDYTAMDVLPIPNTDEELMQATYLFGEIAGRNIYPYNFNKIEKIKTWLPQDVQLKFDWYFEEYEQRKMDVIATIHEGNDRQIAKTRDALQSIEHKIVSVKKAIEICNIVLDSASKKATNYITFRGNFIAEEEPNTPDKLDTLAELSLEEKIQMLELNELLVKKDWQGYLDKIAKYYQGADELMGKQMALTFMIGEDVPFELIEPLLQDNVRLPDDTMLLIALKNDVGFAKKLLPYGLDVNVKGPSGQSMLEYANENKLSPEMKAFIKEHSS